MALAIAIAVVAVQLPGALPATLQPLPAGPLFASSRPAACLRPGRLLPGFLEAAALVPCWLHPCAPEAPRRRRANCALRPGVGELISGVGGPAGLCMLFPASHGAGARGRAGVLHRAPHDTSRAGSRGRGRRTQLAALSTGRKAELILKEVKSVDGVDVNIKLENLGGSRRRISGESGAMVAAICLHLIFPHMFLCSVRWPSSGFVLCERLNGTSQADFQLKHPRAPSGMSSQTTIP